MKVFYDHIILIEDVFMEIEELDISEAEKTQAKKLVDDIMHQKVLLSIFDLLPKEHHEEFLKRFSAAPYDLELLKFLEIKTNRDIYAELILIGEKLKQEMRREIKKTHRKKP